MLSFYCENDLIVIITYYLWQSLLYLIYKPDDTGVWQKNFKIFDHLGSIRAVVYSNGTIVEKYGYEPYGMKLDLSMGKDRLDFIGKEKDNESNLGDYGVRKYEDVLGRFTSIDPLWEKYYGWSPYVYAGNNPLTFVDFNGKFKLSKQDYKIDRIFSLGQLQQLMQQKIYRIVLCLIKSTIIP